MGYLDEYYKLKKKREEQMQKSTKSSSASTSTKTSTDSPYLNTYNQLKAEREAKASANSQKLSTMITDTEEETVKEKKTFLDKLSNLGTAYAKGQYYLNGGAYQSPEQQSAMNDFFDKATVKSKEDDKKWFNSGLFEDGWQRGDLAKTILGTGADILEDVGTALFEIPEKAIDAFAYIGPLVTQGQFNQNGGDFQSPEVRKMQEQVINQAKKDSAEFIEKDLYNGNAIAKRILSEVPGAMQMTNINQAGGFATAEDWERNRQMQKEAQGYIDNTMEDTSVLGEKSDALVQSAGQLAATMALQGLGVPWFLTTGLTSFGAEAENALSQGATYEEAGLSATITAGAEILTEKISGGIKFGGKTLDEGLTRQLSRVITDKTMRTLAKIGVDVAGEGGEEVLSGWLSAVGQKLTYADEKTLGELFSREDALDAFIGGAILGGVSSTGQAINETVKNNDYASGLTNSEKAVVDKVYEEEVAKQEETKGKELSQSEKSKIYDKTLLRLEKGDIDTDTIESVLGGESYNNYKTTVDSEEAIMKEYEELGKKEHPTLADTSRYTALEQQVKDIKEKSNRTQLREKLDNDMLGLVQNTKLAESYNEKARRKQKFEADLTQYDSKQAEVVKKAVESGILNNTNKTHDFVDWIAKTSAEKGVSFDFTNNKKLKESGFALEGKTVNGFVKDGNISLNIDSAKALNTVVGHEITHVLDGTELYTELQTAIKKFAETKKEYATRLKAITELYKDVDGANIEAELTADLVGDYLFTDADFINSLSTEHRNVFQKIYDEIKYLYKVATAGSKEARELEKVKKAFDKAYRESGNIESDTTRYMLQKDNKGKQYWKIDTQKDIFKDLQTTKEIEKAAFDYILQQRDGNVIVDAIDGKKMSFIRISAEEFTNSEESQQLKQNDPVAFAQKMRLIPSLDDLAENANVNWQSPDLKDHKLFKEGGFENFRGRVGIDNVIFNYVIRSGKAKFGDVFYDINLEVDQILPHTNSASEIKESTSKNSLSQDSEKSSATYSLSDNGKLVDNKGNEVALETSGVGTHNSLMAIHNLSAEKLRGILELGGFPVPSIAIIDENNVGNLGYGEISVLLDKTSIDPANRKNEVYGSDVYSRRFPKTVQEVNDRELSKLQEYLGSEIDVEDTTLENAISKYKYKNEFANKFIEENGIEVEPVYKEVGYNYAFSSNEIFRNFVVENDVTFEKLLNDESLRNEFYEVCRQSTPKTFSKAAAFAEKKIEFFEQAFNSASYSDQYLTTKQRLNKDFNSIKNGAEKEFDAYETEKLRRSTVLNDYNEQFTEFLREKLSPVFGDKYIRNNRDTFLPSGNRRSFKQLYDTYTLDNIMKNMLGKVQGEEGFFYGAGNIRSNVSPRFNSIADIKNNADKLISSEEFKQIKEQINEKLDALTSEAREYGGYEYDSYAYALNDISQLKNITIERAKKIFSEYDFDMPENMVQKSLDFLDDLKNAPTEYFEAKPQRAVGLDEVQAVVIPNNTETSLKKQLSDSGLYVVEYDPNIEGDKETKINQFDNLKFSLSSQSQDIAPVGNYNVFGKDVALEQDIAPVEEIAPTTEAVEPSAEVYAPLTEEEANERDDAQIDSKYFLDQMAPEPETPIYNEDAIPESPFDERDFEDVGSQKVKAYMYENPEVKPFFQEEARIMLTELDNSVKGERVVNANMLYESGGEFGVYGTKRMTSEAIAYLRDSKYQYTYDKIRQGLNAIIEDHGAENNAISKRIEFLLDERLREGYTDTIFTGEKIPPNQEYLNLLTEKQITEYNDEAWNNFVRGLSQEDMQQYIGTEEEIAPPVQSELEIAPVREDLPLYEDASGQQSMFESEDTETKRVNDFLQKERAKVTEAYEQKKAELQGLIADQNTYRSNKALELYNELSNLTKGVKASEQLGYLLDYGYPWSEVKKALRNIWYHPSERVDANSIPESVAREMLDKEFETESYALAELETEYKRQLEEVEAKAEEMRTKEKAITRSALHGDIIDSIRSKFAAKGYDLDDVLNSAKNLSTFATVDNTPQRVLEKALGYKQGQILSDLTVNQVAQNETDGTKWLDSFTNRKNGLLAQISKQYNIKPGSKESAAAQMYAEGFYVDENNNIIAYGDAELAKDFPNQNVQANIKGLANDTRIREVYDNTLAMINASRKRNAYPEIPRLDNYFLHFRAMEDTFSRLGLPFNPNDIRAKDLPTDLNGVTADLKPGQPYFASAMHRTGKRTSFDLLGGLERYLTSAKNQIYHIDDIQTLRALRNYIADTYGQAHGLENLDTLTEEEAQERIEEVYGSHLSTFAKFLNEEANVIAGKTTLIDRGLEGVIGRRGITFLDTINRQVGSNMVGFNISSSVTNFLPVAQTFAKTNKADFVKAFAQTVSNKVTSLFGRNDGFAEQSPVMIRRKGADRFYRTPWQKVGDAGYVFMGAVDSISTELIARTKYNELTRKGMDSQKAHYETDKWVSRMMGDRSLGQQPQLYNSKMLGIFTKFQLEVRNQLDAQFYDTIQEAKVSNEEIQNGLARNAKTAAKVTSAFVQLAVVQHLFGKAFESVAGYNPAFDIIGAILKAVGFDDDEESEDTVLDNLEQGFLELLGDLPYTSTFTGGRIPISSALPVEQFVTGKDDYGNEKSRWETIKEAAPYYVLPTGYGQIKKTYQGLSMFDDDLPIAGSYTDSGNLRFPVEDTLQNRVQAGIFGQWASDNARDYFDNERNPLKEKQIEELVDLDLPIADYWEYREGLAKQETLEDKFDYIAGLDVSVEQKNIMINNVVDRKEKVDMSNYDDFSGYEEFDFYAKNTDKYNFLQDNGVSYSEYISSEDAKKEYDNAYSWYKNNPEKVTVSKAITDNVIEYRRYTSELNGIRADKDADGDSITGSAKEKKIAYIDGLDLDYGQKIILFRSYYDSKEDKETYNADIVDYLNSRDDISYDEMVTILEELDMKVYPDGTVEW